MKVLEQLIGLLLLLAATFFWLRARHFKAQLKEQSTKDAEKKTDEILEEAKKAVQGTSLGVLINAANKRYGGGGRSSNDDPKK